LFFFLSILSILRRESVEVEKGGQGEKRQKTGKERGCIVDTELAL
jgi:hypothetical protein